MVELQEKEELLENFENTVSADMNISFRYFGYVLAIFFAVLVLVTPKIFIQNNIYYESKKFNQYYAQYLSLKEENIALRQQLEDMKFKNQILDYMD